VTLTRVDGDDLCIDILAGGSITINDHFQNSQEDMEEIEFGDGTIWVADDINRALV